MNTTHLVMFFFGGATATVGDASEPSYGWALSRVSRVAELRRMSAIADLERISRVSE